MPVMQRRTARGMTLVEVLIAIVIFAIGLLGIAALQVAGLRYTKGSQTRSVAALQAENLADRMRANTTGVTDGTYVTPPAPTTNCDAAVCTPDELAAFDMAAWLAATRSALGASSTDPNVNGTVCIDSTPDDGTNGAWACDNTGNIYAIKIEWLERTTERQGRSGNAVEDTYAGSGVSTGAPTGFVRNRFVMRMVP